ncbi:MAG: hypothetical protein M3Z66_15920 [Chloroflexota bacterium]|nr:hypothetical protein [Chloroflexota bacterium]
MLKQLISTFRCHVCRQSFEHERVRVAARDEALWVVSVRCGLCRNQQIFLVQHRERRTESLLLDLSEDEQEQFTDMTPVTGNHVLDMHDFLKTFDGDFKGLFSRER